MDPLSTTFAALSDPTRRAILARLTKGEATVGELARPFDVSWPAISRHLKVLESAGLVERRVEAQFRVVRLRGPGLREAARWIGRYREYWDESLDRLVDYLERPRNRRTKR